MNLEWGRTRYIRGLGLSRIPVRTIMEELCLPVAVPEEALWLSLPINVMRK